MRILDLGCGENKVENSIGLDCADLHDVDVKHDLLSFPYPFDDESFELIYLRHVIEHFILDDINNIFNECWRLLKKDGNLIVIVPHVYSISAFMDPTHKSYFTFGSGTFWDNNNQKNYYKNIDSKWELNKCSSKVTCYNWKGYRLKKLDRLISDFYEKRINKFIDSASFPSKSDQIVKKSAFHNVDIKWQFNK